MEPDDIQEEIAEAQQRDAYFGGLLAGLMLAFLVGAAVIAVVSFWPFVEAAPTAQTRPTE